MKQLNQQNTAYSCWHTAERRTRNCAIVFTLVVVLVSFNFFSGCASDKSLETDSTIDLRTEIYGAISNADLINDTRLRSKNPTQTQGTISTLRIGSEFNGVLDLILLDSGVVYNDSIPASATNVACTLWIQVNQMPHFDEDSLVIDLWSVVENWSEGGASWNQRESGVLWDSAGGFGELVTARTIVARRIDLNRFTWSICGEIFDTVATYPSRHLPIPIDSALAQQNIDKASYGFALRTNSETTSGANFGFFSAEAQPEANRPYLLWIYTR